MKEEMIDIYNEKGEYIGIERKSQVKKKGYWHNTFQCWVIVKEEEQKYVIFQRRHKNKKWNPGKLATSAGGHIMAGETIYDGVRELNEELGLFPEKNELVYLGVYKEVRKTDTEDNKENQHVFMYETNKRINELQFQLEELSGIYKIPLEEFENLVEKKKDFIEAFGIEWEDESYKEKEISVKLEDIIGQETLFLSWSLQHIKNSLK